jgi:hypothetical protein
MESRRVLAGALSSVLTIFPASGPIARAVRAVHGSSHHAPASHRRSDHDEIALALTAAPASLTTGATVYTAHDGQFTKAREGSNGWACIVARDARAKGVFPMCFDPEGARTLMHTEMLRTQLFARGLTNTAVDQEITKAYEAGTLTHPTKPAMTVMMSSRQVLTVYEGDHIRVIGAWHPHVMVYLPGASPDQFTLGKEQSDGPLSMPFSNPSGAELVVQVPHWADTQASPEVASTHSNASKM